MSDKDATRSKRSKIDDFYGDPQHFPKWMYSVRLQAMSTESTDILDDEDNPFKRERRTEDEDIDWDPNSKEFAEGEEGITLSKETVSQFNKKRESHTKRRKTLFSDIAASLKENTTNLGMQVKEGDVLGLVKLVTENYGDTSEASRFALIMDFILLRLDSVSDLDAHISKFGELKRRLADLDPTEAFTPGAQTCLYLHSLSACPDFEGLISNALLREKRGGQSMQLKEAVQLSRDFISNTSAMKSDSAVNAFRTFDRDGGRRGADGGGGDKSKKRKIKCHHCGKMGHIKADCRKRKRELQDGNDGGNKLDKSNGKKRARFDVGAVTTAKAMAVSKKAHARSMKGGVHELLMDCAATKTCINKHDQALLTNTKPCDTELIVADGGSRGAACSGTLAGLFNPDTGDEMEGTVSDALSTPTFSRSLLAAIGIVKNGGAVHLERGNCYFRPTKANLKVAIKIRGDDFVVPIRALPTATAASTAIPTAAAVAADATQEEQEEEDEEEEEIIGD